MDGEKVVIGKSRGGGNSIQRGMSGVEGVALGTHAPHQQVSKFTSHTFSVDPGIILGGGHLTGLDPVVSQRVATKREQPKINLQRWPKLHFRQKNHQWALWN